MQRSEAQLKRRVGSRSRHFNHFLLACGQSEGSLRLAWYREVSFLPQPLLSNFPLALLFFQPRDF